jgi:hypothetical protein
MAAPHLNDPGGLAAEKAALRRAALAARARQPSAWAAGIGNLVAVHVLAANDVAAHHAISVASGMPSMRAATPCCCPRPRRAGKNSYSANGTPAAP